MGLASKTWKPARKFDFFASKLEKVASNSDFPQVNAGKWQVNGGKWQVNIYLPQNKGGQTSFCSVQTVLIFRNNR